MGLDIYLYRITATKEEFDAREALREAMDKAGNDCYPPDAEFKLLTQEEQDAVYERSKAAKKKLAKAHGLKADKYGDVKSLEEEVNIPSAKYPEHYFKIGYFRSSYNDGGIDSYFRRLGLPDLHEIMGRGDDDEYRFAPDWKASKDRALETLARLDAMPNTDIDYRQDLEIIVETCDHVLSQPDPQAFYLHWSG